MKKALIGFIIFTMLMSCGTSSSTKFHLNNFKKYEELYNVHELIIQTNKYDFKTQELAENSLFIYANIQKMFVLIFIICILLLIVTTPVLLFFHR